MRRAFVLATAAALVAALAAPAGAKPGFAAAAKPGDATIAEIAVAAGSFTTLVAALDCTGLLAEVQGDDQLTVFAPTDAAFAQLGLNDGNVCTEIRLPDLTDILLYHVTQGRRISPSVVNAPSLTMLNGGTVSVEETTLNEVATIVAADISASNGIIHVIDAVLLP